jgi:hypothetical protein
MSDVAAESLACKPRGGIQTSSATIDQNGELVIGASRLRHSLLIQVPPGASTGIELFGGNLQQPGYGILLAAGQERNFRLCQGAFWARTTTAGQSVRLQLAWSNDRGDIGKSGTV